MSPTSKRPVSSAGLGARTPATEIRTRSSIHASLIRPPPASRGHSSNHPCDPPQRRRRRVFGTRRALRTGCWHHRGRLVAHAAESLPSRRWRKSSPSTTHSGFGGWSTCPLTLTMRRFGHRHMKTCLTAGTSVHPVQRHETSEPTGSTRSARPAGAVRLLPHRGAQLRPQSGPSRVRRGRGGRRASSTIPRFAH